MPSLASQYATESTVSSTSGTAAVGVAFGFMAQTVLVYNDKAVPVYVSLNSTAGSTGGHRTCAGELLSVAGIMSEALGLASTTTSTAGIVRVLALGR